MRLALVRRKGRQYFWGKRSGGLQYLQKHITDLLIIFSQVVRIDPHQEAPVCTWRHLSPVPGVSNLHT